MRTNVYETAELGDLVVVAFDEAAHYSTDPKEVSRLATLSVMHMWRRARMVLPPMPLLEAGPKVAGTS